MTRGPTVVLVCGRDRREMVRMALTGLGKVLEHRMKRAKKIFIHPNLVTNHRQAATTHVEAVRGIVDHISLHRGDTILIGDAGVRNTKSSFRVYGYPSLKRSGNIQLVDLNDDVTIPSYAYTADMKKRPIGFSKMVADADMNVVVVPAKMHSYYQVSLSIKTHIVGSLVVQRTPTGMYFRWPWLHTGFRPAHRTLADLYADHPAHLAVIDGTQAMEGEGPAAGDEVNLKWILASFNPVAADAVAAYLMGITPSDIGYLYYLAKKGFGPIDLSNMRIKGPDPKTLRKNLKRPDGWDELLDWK